MNVNRRTTTVLAIIVVILIAVFGITRWQRSVATAKLLAELPGHDYAKVLDAMTQLKERGGSITGALLDQDHLASNDAAAKWRSATLLGDVGTSEAFEPLQRALGDESPDVRAAAALALGKLSVKAAGSALQDLVKDDEEVLAVRVAAVQALSLLRDESAASLLQTVLTDTIEALEAKAFVTYTAAETAKEAIETAIEAAAEPAEDADPEALQEAITAAREAAETAAETAAEALALSEAVGGRDPAQFVVPEDTPPEDAPTPPSDATGDLRVACARALGVLGTDESVAALGTALDTNKEPNGDVRTAAAYALADLARRVGDQSGIVDRLLTALEDETGDVRAAALHSMSFVKADAQSTDRLKGALTGALSDDFYWAREAAKASMKKLGIRAPQS